jgi:hypothetical protein
MARLAALSFTTFVLLSLSGLLYAAHQHAVALATGAVAFLGFVASILVAAASLPHDRIRAAGEYSRIGGAAVVVNVVLALSAAPLFVITDDLIPGAIYVIVSLAMATLGAGMFNAARRLQFVPMLISAGEEPHALALGANAMPGRHASLVVATGDRIVWAEGRRLRERHAVRLADVDRFDADYRTGTLTVLTAGDVRRVSPVPKRELEKFEDLLRGSTATGS